MEKEQVEKISYKQTLIDYLKGLTNYKGKTTTKGYVWPIITQAILLVLVNLALVSFDANSMVDLLVNAILLIGIILLNLPLTVRRLRDIGFSKKGIITILSIDLFIAILFVLFGILSIYAVLGANFSVIFSILMDYIPVSIKIFFVIFTLIALILIMLCLVIGRALFPSNSLTYVRATKFNKFFFEERKADVQIKEFKENEYSFTGSIKHFILGFRSINGETTNISWLTSMFFCILCATVLFLILGIFSGTYTIPSPSYIYYYYVYVALGILLFLAIVCCGVIIGLAIETLTIRRLRNLGLHGGSLFIMYIVVNLLFSIGTKADSSIVRIISLLIGLVIVLLPKGSMKKKVKA